MDKKWIICIIITIIIGLSIGIGLAVYSSSNGETEDMDLLSEKELADSEETNSNILQNTTNTVETSAIDANISPNAILIKKIYYETCDHLIREAEDIPEELVNKTEEDVKEAYSDWKVEEFSPTQIILYKTKSGNCGEHYFVQDHNGVIGIYITDEYGVKTLQEDTEISTQYLPEEDLTNLKAGIEIIGKTNLTEFLEDYE